MSEGVVCATSWRPPQKRARPQSLPLSPSPRAGYRQAAGCDKSRPVFVSSAGATKDALGRSSGAKVNGLANVFMAGARQRVFVVGLPFSPFCGVRPCACPLVSV